MLGSTALSPGATDSATYAEGKWVRCTASNWLQALFNAQFRYPVRYSPPGKHFHSLSLELLFDLGGAFLSAAQLR